MISVNPRLDKRRRVFVRLLGDIQHALNVALNEEQEKRGLNKTKIAKMLGLHRSAVSKKFDGRHNMTVETLADLAFALERRVVVSLREQVATPPGSNQGTQEPSSAPELASIKSAVASQSQSAARQDAMRFAVRELPVFATRPTDADSIQSPRGLASVRSIMGDKQ